jgi:hypothetical protein
LDLGEERGIGMIKLYDVVKSSKDLNDKVLKGCIGTVVMVYSDSPPAYEVEFFDDANETLDLLTVSSVDIVKF